MALRRKNSHSFPAQKIVVDVVVVIDVFVAVVAVDIAFEKYRRSLYFQSIFFWGLLGSG